MKTTLGGDRLGSGQKNLYTDKTFGRSSHDIGTLWRSSMSAGTLVPFMSLVATPGTTLDIDLNAEVRTLPTIGPLFGSYKVQLDVFSVPYRVYNAGLHMNRLGIGMDMSQAYLPKIKVLTNNHASYVQTFDDNEQINPSCLLKYLGISGLGWISGTTNPAARYFNAVPLLMYWDVFKNYYSNKQEEVGYYIDSAGGSVSAIQNANLFESTTLIADIEANPTAHTGTIDTNLDIVFSTTSLEPDPDSITITINGNSYTPGQAFDAVIWNDTTKTLQCGLYNSVETGSVTWNVAAQTPDPLGGVGVQIVLNQFALSNIDDMREDILQYPFASGAFQITASSAEPYGSLMTSIDSGANLRYKCQFSQAGLAVKTYQSDLFNNWLDTDWIDGVGGINEVTAVDTSGGDFTIDALNLATKVYKMLNRVALSGGSYDDWLNAVYTHERTRHIDSPVYHGSLIKELAFQEVISNADTTDNPLGTLAGRGVLTDKHKGGKIVIKCDEISHIMGIVSITPRVDYSQGNDWTVNLETFDDFHKPDLDAIAYQDLITDQMSWTDTELVSSTSVVNYSSAGKQPAWINYMTDVNRVYGNFAEQNQEMFMVLNRRYDKNTTGGGITDLTTYIDPSKFNHIFADTSLDSQNFWVQISKNITRRAKMSAKQIPNL